MTKQSLVAAVLLVSGLAGAARAADMPALFGQSDEPEALPPQSYTFGSGWYLRGDLAASDDLKPDVLAPLQAETSHRDWNYSVGGGVGYKFNSMIRADVTGEYLGPQKTVDTEYNSFGSLSVKSNLRRYDALVNAYADLGTWGGLTPYVGAGVGVAGIRLDGSYVIDEPQLGFDTYDRVPGKTRYDLAWAAMAGVSYNVTANLLIDIGYRYLDLGSYEVPRFAVSPFNQGLKTDLNSHQIRAGIRYMIF